MKDRLLIGILLAAVALVYGNSLVSQFTQDDDLYIVNNPQVTQPSLRALFSPNHISSVFRPVTFATMAINWKLGGLEPFGYHLLNLFMHAGVVWLLYILLQSLLGASPRGRIVAFVATLLFAVHPIHTEAVAAVVGRAELLAAGFLLAAWILHLRDRQIPALFCFALAVLSKESAVAFFPLVLIGDYATGQWKSRPRYAWIGGITILYLGILWKVQGGRFGQATISMLDNPLASVSAQWRILNALRVAWKYVALQIYPAVLSCDYSFNQIPVFRDWRHTLPAAVATAAVIGAWIWAMRKRQTGVTLAGGIYLAAFATTANILVPTGTILGERLAYLPSVGFCLLLAIGWSWMEERQRALAWGTLAIVLVALSARTMVRNRDWKDNLSLFSAAVRAVPNSAKMHSFLATEYMDRNQYEMSRNEFQIALQINPEFPDALSSYGLLEMRQGNYQKAGGMMEKALFMSDRSNPNFDSMRVNFAAVLSRTNHVDGALDLMNREIAESPGYVHAWSTRALVHMKRGEFAAARADVETALQLDPSDGQTQEALQLLNTLQHTAPAR
jgi:protein O-mannosyl-transferase